MNQQYPSILLEKAVGEFSKLPGIGRKTAMRLVLHLLRQDTATSTTMEGDTTNFYIYRKLDKLGVKLSVIARGISVGDELEYADEVTLGRSIVNRTLFTGTV